MALTTTITAAGYKAAVKNSNGAGFNIDITAVEAVKDGRVMGRFAASGVARNAANIILRATIKSLRGEEYAFNRLNLIDASGVVFAIVENDDKSVIDTVTKYKNAVLEYTLSYVLAEAGKITVESVNLSIFATILHSADDSVHADLFRKKIEKTQIVDSLDTPDGTRPVSAYQGAILRNRFNQVKEMETRVSVENHQGVDFKGRHRQGKVIKFPDGRVVQTFTYQGDIVHLTDAEANDGNVRNSRLFHCVLWEAMPKQIYNVTMHLHSVGNDGVTEHTGMQDGEAAFWQPIWNFSKNESDTGSAFVYLRRRAGGNAAENNPHVNISITVEGY